MTTPSAPKTIGVATYIVSVVIALAIGAYLGSVFTTLHEPAPAPVTRQPPPAQAEAPVDPSQDPRFADLIRHTLEHPNEATPWTDLGNAYFDANMPEKAISAYQRSLELEPNTPNVWTDLGVMFRRAGRYNKAVEAFRAAIKLDPEHQVSRFNMGIVLMHDLNDVDGALKAWRGLLEINPDAKAPNGTPVRDLVEEIAKTEGAS